MLRQTPYGFEREVPGSVNWSWRMNAIIGARGVGKTTVLLQRLRTVTEQGKQGVYLTLDDPYFTEVSLFDFAERFEREGGTHLFIDEVHKYPDWGRHLKNIYDLLPELMVVFSGSSVLDIHAQGKDLSRRALYYTLPGLSFREYLAITGQVSIEKVALENILEKHRELANDLLASIRPLAPFKAYLDGGYYPFIMDHGRDYQRTLEQLVQLVIEVDMQFLANLDPAQGRKLLQLLRIIGHTPPFKPNISKLSERIGVERKTLLRYLHHLDQARLLKLATLPEGNSSVLQKPDKLYLENPNLYYVMTNGKPEKGSQRETFFINQLSVTHQVSLHRKTDFAVDGTWAFEVGGRNKSKSQLSGMDNAYIAMDDLEIGHGNVIPLWLFGFLY